MIVCGGNNFSRSGMVTARVGRVNHPSKPPLKGRLKVPFRGFRGKKI